jgi:two-component system chemotaxis response regulator CheY
MAPMSGLDLLQAARAEPLLRVLPFILISAESKSQNVVAAKQAGASNCIVKPFTAETLREKIEVVPEHG